MNANTNLTDQAANTRRGNRWIAIGAVFGLLAVGFGAFGAHGLEDYFAELAKTDPALAVKRLGNWRTASQYQMHHSLAIVLAGILIHCRGSRLASYAAGCFTIGLIIFSGCLYTLVLTEVRVWGAPVFLGGLGFMAGWILLALAALTDKPTEPTNQECDA